ncbi:MAG: C-GCAxxG-C-C family (seleno)protein [Chloroflexota bacterium]
MASNEREKAESQSADAKRQAAERAYALGFEYEQKYENCAQCLLAAVHELVGGVDEALFKASHNLAGGGGLTTKGTCGALSGGMLAFGSRYGRERENFTKRTGIRRYAKSKELLEKFVGEFGSPICGDVQTRLMGRSFDLWSEDYKAFEEAGGHRDKCPHVVGTVAKWVVEMFEEGS